MEKTYLSNIWTEKFRIFDLKEDEMIENKKSEFSEIVAEISQFAGALASAALVGGKNVISYLYDMTIVDTILKPPADEVQTTDR